MSALERSHSQPCWLQRMQAGRCSLLLPVSLKLPGCRAALLTPIIGT